MSHVLLRMSIVVALVFPAHAYAVDLLKPVQNLWGDSEPQTQVGSYTTPNLARESSAAWYLRGDLGYSTTNMPEIDASSGIIAGTKAPGYAGLQLGVGYKFNSWFRTDLTYEYDSKYNQTNSTFVAANPTSSLKCIRSETVASVYDTNGKLTGYSHKSWDAPGCTLEGQYSMARQNILLNAYFDLGHFGNFSPYVGFGIGTSVTQATASSTAYFADSHAAVGSYAIPEIADGTTTLATVAGYYNLDNNQSHTTYNLATALHAGFTYDLSDITAIDVGYRYLRSGNYTPFGNASSSAAPAISSQNIHVGLRILLP